MPHFFYYSLQTIKTIVKFCKNNFKCILCRDKVVFIGLVIFYMLVGLTSIFGNMITLVVAFKFKLYTHVQYIYKFSIAASDALWGFMLIYYLIEHYRLNFLDLRKNDLLNFYMERNFFISDRVETNVFSLSNYILLLDNFFTSSCFHVSILTLLLSAYDRYKSLAYPFLYRRTKSVKKAVYLSVVVWVVVIIGSLHNLLPIKNFYASNAIVFIIFELVPFILIWIITFLCIFSLRKSHTSSKKLSRRKLKRRKLKKQNTELTLSILFIAMVLALTFSLSFYIYIHARSFLSKSKPSLNFLLFADAVLSTNSFWNFMLYNVLNKKYRKYVIALLFKTKC